MPVAEVCPSVPDAAFTAACIAAGLTPEQINRLCNEPQPVGDTPDYESKVARRLHELGFPKLADRVDNCGCWYRYHECKGPDGHMYKENSSRCMKLHACVRCALRNAELQLQKFSPLAEYMSGQFTYLTVTGLGNIPIEELKSMASQATLRMTRQLPDLGMVKILYVGNRRQAELRILYAGPEEPTAVLRELWPQAKVVGELCPM
jgi:hypothetical protein